MDERPSETGGLALAEPPEWQLEGSYRAADCLRPILPDEEEVYDIGFMLEDRDDWRVTPFKDGGWLDEPFELPPDPGTD